MTERRRRSPAPAKTSRPVRFAVLRAHLTGRGLLRLANRGSLAALSIAIIAVFASWSASGFLDRGGLERLVRMKNTPERAAASALGRNGPLDRGRLNAVISATGKAAP